MSTGCEFCLSAGSGQGRGCRGAGSALCRLRWELRLEKPLWHPLVLPLRARGAGDAGKHKMMNSSPVSSWSCLPWHRSLPIASAPISRLISLLSAQAFLSWLAQPGFPGSQQEQSPEHMCGFTQGLPQSVGSGHRWTGCVSNKDKIAALIKNPDPVDTEANRLFYVSLAVTVCSQSTVQVPTGKSC